MLAMQMMPSDDDERMLAYDVYEMLYQTRWLTLTDNNDRERKKVPAHMKSRCESEVERGTNYRWTDLYLK